MNGMLSLHTQESNMDYIITQTLLNEVISQREVIIIAGCNIDESILLYRQAAVKG